MALPKDQIAANYPLPAYNYRVDIGADTIAFSEVSGLEIKLGTITYSESPTAGGSPGPVALAMPGIPEFLTITLKKGLVKTKSIKALYAWIASTQLNRIDKKDISIYLCDEKGDAVVVWKVIDAFPTKLSAPTFSASANEAAIETMELMADNLVISEP